VPDADRRAAIAAVFDAAADAYDNVDVEFFTPIAERLVQELAPQAGESCLDVGCGGGQALIELARAVGPSGRAVGIDLAPRMVAAATAAAEAAGVDVEVHLGDAQEPEVEGRYDVIAASLVLFFFPDPVAALGAWHELLVDGGRVGVSTFGAYLTPAWRSVDAVFAPYLAQQTSERRDDAPDPFASVEGVQGLLVDAGFSQVRTTSSVVSPRFDDHDHWFRWTMSHGQRGRWLAVPPDDHTDVLAAAASALEQCRDRDGRIGFDQTVHFTLGRRGGTRSSSNQT
jgi:ubiquinone/menaquinone biosynthesis C-methylase UbiE